MNNPHSEVLQDLLKAAAGTKTAAKHPDIMYHHTDPANRESILRLGLDKSFSDAYQSAKEMGEPDDRNLGSGIFFDTVPTWSEGPDIWEVDVRGLDLEPDDTTDISGTPEYDGHEWWVLYGASVPPERLKLVTKPQKNKRKP